MNRGVSLTALRKQFGDHAVGDYDAVIAELLSDGLVVRAADNLSLTARGRLLSNEVFERFLREGAVDHRDTKR